MTDINAFAPITLPEDFIFGAATSAFQIEGAVNEDGRGPSIWDEFTAKKGRIRSGHNAVTACDHYHRFETDVDLMKRMRLQAYRFSVAWPRIMPTGTGSVNMAGLDFYSRLTDSLLEAGIEPFATLFHWDMPLSIYQNNGGFISRDTCDYFADYVEVVVKVLGDRIKNWITLNEPFEHACFGHLLGNHAPGHHRMGHFLKAMHHQLLAHGKAVERIRSISDESKVGITLSLTPILPSSDSANDKWAAEFGNQLLNHITLSALYKGRYPEELQQRLRWFWPKIEDGDMALIGTPSDFVGVNHYNCEYASHRWYIPFLKSWISGANAADAEYEQGGKWYTAMGWEVNPWGMYEVLRMLREDYGNPEVYITENGAAFEDTLVNGEVNDSKRIEYFQGYFAEVIHACGIGSKIKGYFAWSLLDNFEWAEGYEKRFGLIHVDYETQKRTLKDSALWYSWLIKHRTL
ncbi:GH1 family beta-glucosidase [Teredinibacter turnerae]|uniref:GH1 family beta-glucosidase n=1 Tax=Teredinibacter turnerae TaxID=2426 RepID=UPI0005F85EBC|nr:GH1 family beta-glucosidase [Teredinibacter turnerae]